MLVSQYADVSHLNFFKDKENILKVLGERNKSPESVHWGEETENLSKMF